jgi:hypothetical protein
MNDMQRKCIIQLIFWDVSIEDLLLYKANIIDDH